MTENLIKPVYRGTRTSYFIYHPKETPGLVYEEARRVFDEKVKQMREIADLYSDEITREQRIFTKHVMIELRDLLKDIDSRGDVYLLEALYERLYDDKHYKVFPYFKELQERANELRAEDSGIILPNDPRVLNRKIIRL